jgi:hypothetical protein
MTGRVGWSAGQRVLLVCLIALAPHYLSSRAVAASRELCENDCGQKSATEALVQVHAWRSIP